MREITKNPQQSDIPYDKLNQAQIFRNAVDGARKKRADKPNEFPNDVWSIKVILLPKERQKIEQYLTDYKPYTEQLQKIEDDIKDCPDWTIQNRIRLMRKRDISFYHYTNELNRQYKENQLEDMNYDNQINKQDLTIKLYEGLLEKIIDILVEGKWISTGSSFEIGHD